MKKEGFLKITLSVLVIILVTLISIWGVYIKSGSTMKNILPDYEYGMELKDTNIINLEVVKEENSEEPTEEATTEEVADGETTEENKDENAGETAENGEENTQNTEETKTNEQKNNVKDYAKAKQIIEKRLKFLDVNQYTIRLDEKTGNMVLEVPTEVASIVSQNEFSKGNFEIKIKDNDEVIADKNSIQDIKTSINNQYADVDGYGSIVEMNIIFNKDAIKKFTDIKNTYSFTVKEEKTEETEETEEDSTEDEGIKNREVTLYLNGSDLYTTELEDFIKYASSGTLPLSMGGYTKDTKALEGGLQQANATKSLILTENLPVEYTSSATSNIHSNINKKSIEIVFAVLVAVMFIYLIIKNKLQGLFGGLTILGFVSTLLLIVRFTNVALTMSSIFAVGVMMLLQFIYLMKLLNGKINTKHFNETTFGFMKLLVPVFLMAIAISFSKVLELVGFGEVVFWGIVVFVIFNNIITRLILTNGKNK